MTMDSSAAMTDIRTARAAGRKIVFTNGCFDLIHAGHVALLDEAAGLGDFLVVGMNSDASVRRLKGPDRPYNAEEDRRRVLAAIRHVDAVVLFDEDTPLRIITEIRPDVLVKGADYGEGEIVGAAEVRSWGGVVHRVALLAGRSTSVMLERMKDEPHRKPEWGLEARGGRMKKG